MKDCEQSCDANLSLVTDDCKFCPIKVPAIDFGVEDKANQCYSFLNNESNILTILFHYLARTSHVQWSRHSFNVRKFAKTLHTAVLYSL